MEDLKAAYPHPDWQDRHEDASRDELMARMYAYKAERDTAEGKLMDALAVVDATRAHRDVEDRHYGTLTAADAVLYKALKQYDQLLSDDDGGNKNGK